jgi:hypothetical protein
MIMSTFWKVEESTGGPYYFTWDGSFPTREAALAAIDKITARTGRRPNARAVLYRMGSGFNTGPVRVEE